MINKSKSGSALLISILLTSILILLIVGLSQLITSETRQITDLINNAKAEYLAEGGVEIAQHIYYNSDFDDFGTAINTIYDLEFEGSDSLSFSIESMSNHVPIRSEELFQDNLHKNLLFQRLLPGESIDIFLKDNTEHFEVEYYVPALKNIEEITNDQFSYKDLDVLLFKLSGVQKDTTNDEDNYKIDFITEYFPASNNVEQPAKLTTDEGSSELLHFNGGNFFAYSDGEEQSNSLEVNTDYVDINDETNIEDEQLESMTEEAEFEEYFIQYDKDWDPPVIEFKEETNPILEKFQHFLKNHTNNALSLSNAINLATIHQDAGSDPSTFLQTKELLGSLYFRVCTPSCTTLSTYNPSLISPFITIQSTAIINNKTKKSLLTELSRPNALSVFDFAIYQVDTNL